MGTVAFAAKKKLIDLSRLDSGIRTALAVDVDSMVEVVWDSSYSGSSRPRRLLWFGEIVWEGEEFGPAGMLRRIETFDIRCAIEINDYDPNQTSANDKAEAVMVALEAMLKDPRVLLIGGIESLGIVPIGLGEGPATTQGRAAIMAMQIHIRARK